VLFSEGIWVARRSWLMLMLPCLIVRLELSLIFRRSRLRRVSSRIEHWSKQVQRQFFDNKRTALDTPLKGGFV